MSPSPLSLYTNPLSLQLQNTTNETPQTTNNDLKVHLDPSYIYIALLSYLAISVIAISIAIIVFFVNLYIKRREHSNRGKNGEVLLQKQQQQNQQQQELMDLYDTDTSTEDDSTVDSDAVIVDLDEDDLSPVEAGDEHFGIDSDVEMTGGKKVPQLRTLVGTSSHDNNQDDDILLMENSPTLSEVFVMEDTGKDGKPIDKFMDEPDYV